jgi:hypothetical protein
LSREDRIGEEIKSDQVIVDRCIGAKVHRCIDA